MALKALESPTLSKTIANFTTTDPISTNKPKLNVK